MVVPIYIQLLENAILLICLSIIYDLFYLRKPIKVKIIHESISGLLIGSMAIILMARPLVLEPGIIFDTRSILLSVSGLFFGFIPTFVCVFISLIFRFLIGGSGTLMGAFVIISSASIGLLWKRVRMKNKRQLEFHEVYLFGVTVHIFMLLGMILLPMSPSDPGLWYVRIIVILFYPVFTVLLARVFEYHRSQWEAAESLLLTKDRLRRALTASTVGLWEWDFITNQVWYSTEWKKQIGYEDHEISPEYSEWETRIHPDDLDSMKNNIEEAIQNPNQNYQFEFRFQHKDGSYLWILADAALYFDKKGNTNRMLGSHVDITASKKAAEEIEKELREKELLIRELYHRTKNNMQVISSMLKIYARRVENKQLKMIFNDIDTKIKTMALVQQKLYDSGNLSQVNLKDYFQSLISLIQESYLVLQEHVELLLSGEDVTVLLDTANPCGLVLTELISNCLKHAFPGSCRGKVEIQLGVTPQNVLIFEVKDNGVGLPEGFDMKNDKKMGLETVINLVEYQLRGNVEFINQEGLTCRVSLKEELYSARV